jgi:hypothetical protein
MKPAKGLRTAGIGLAICLIVAPVAFAVTIGLLPLWSWVEAKFAIESVGHSGPAGWCYLAVFIFILSGAVIIRLAFLRRSGAS